MTLKSAVPTRLIAIAHRVKARVLSGEKVEALPTQVFILDSATGEGKNISLADEAAELDFICGTLPTRFEKDGEGKKTPVEWEGLKAGDGVLMTLGGSGDPLAYAISRKGEDVGFTLHRMPPWALKKLRGEKPNKQDERDSSELSILVKAWQEKLAPFYHCDPADRERMEIAFKYASFKDTQLARMGHVARMRQSVIGSVFMSPDGLYPEGLMTSLLSDFIIAVKKMFQKKNKAVEVYEALNSAEMGAKKDLEKAVESSHVWKLFEPIPGVGPSIAGALISAIGDIRKFETEAKLWAFCGLHTLKPDGTKFQEDEEPVGGIMARRRSGQLSNWNPKGKQALFLLGDQFNRRPDSYWGQKLRANKLALRQKHPEAVKNDAGKMRYNDGHIHKMAVWKTLRQFTRWMYREWTRLENDSGYAVKHPSLSPSPSAHDGEKLAA